MRKLILAAVAAVVGVQGVGLAGAIPGPRENTTRVTARGTDRYEIVFRGGEVTRIVVDGDRTTDLDLYVYDENGNLVAKDDDNTDYCVVSFTPRWTGKFTVRVVNRGSVWNQYKITTN
jgi:hypothetical protein